MRTLIIFEEIPEYLTIYDLDVSDLDMAKLERCHEHYCNAANLPDDHPVNEWLSTWLEDKKDKIIYSSKEKGDILPPVLREAKDRRIIVTGFMM